MPTLAELLQPRTQQQELSQLLTYLQARGLTVTDYNSGGVARTLLEVSADGLADLSQFAVTLAQSGYLEFAETDWLDLLTDSQWDVRRNQATAAVGSITLSCAAGFGPVTVTANTLLVGTSNGLRYNVTGAGQIPDGGSITLAIRAEGTGAAYNVATGTITTLHTPILGVTCTNSSSWLTTAGVDTETDTALRQRARLRWAELGYGATSDAYRYWALTARPEVTRVLVLDNLPRGQGTVDVVIYGTGGLGSGVVSDVDAYIQLRKPLTADVSVYQATMVNVPVVATIYVKSGFLDAAQTAVAAEINTLQTEAEIGGYLYKSRILEALFVRPYVVNVDMTAPTTDTDLGTVEVANLVTNLTWVEV